MSVVLDLLLEHLDDDLSTRCNVIQYLPGVRQDARLRFRTLCVPAAGEGEDPAAPTRPIPFG